MRKKFQLMKDRNHRPGEHELFQHRFAQLLLLQEYRYKEQKHHELLVQGWRHAKVMEEKGEPIEVSALFDPDQNTGIQPHTVVLQGAAGIGKTTLAIKVMLDWAEGKLYQERFNYVFYLTCRELNTIGVNVLSFADLIACDWPGHQAPMTEIMSQAERLLFIIDGLDELKFPCDENRCDLCQNWNQQRPVSILLSSLLRKMLLPEASLLLTTRLTALEKFSPLLENSRHVEILGFSVSQRMDYFCKFFRNEELGKKALNLVQGNAPLFTMCSVPLMNWIICTCLKQQEERGQDPLQALKTTTALYMCYFNSLTPDDKNFMPQHLKGLCGLAAEGIWQRKVLFEEEDLRRHNLEAGDVSAFLDMNIFQKDSGCENSYSFIHLSFQEFFAAMFYLMSPDEEWQKSPDFSIPDIRELLREYSENDASFLALVVQFLFGFLNAEIASELQRKFRCRTSLEMKSQLLEWVERKTKGDNGYSYLSCVPLLLYETQDAEIVTQALVNVKEMKLMSCCAYDVLMNTFCIKHCPGIQRLSYDCDFDAPHAVWQDFLSMVSKSQYLKELHLLSSPWIEVHMDKLCMGLRETNCKLEELWLEGFKVPCSCFQYLFSAPSLKSLHLNDINFEDDGMKPPCETLEKENCQLETLEISRLKQWSVYDMDFSLPVNQKNLLLMGTCFQRVMELLCSVLAQQNCKLQVLRLEEFEVPCSCFQYLFSAPSLKSLHLNDITFEDYGMKLPCETLEKENCQLETLEISCLKQWRVYDMDFSLPANHKNLLLMGTCFQRVMELLCSVLAQQNCKLQVLRLEKFKVPSSCFQYLFSAPSLKSLHLNNITFEDYGMKLPCETLEKENCQLETLEISRLKQWSVYDMDFSLPANQKNLLLMGTCFQRVMELLCSVLAQQNCKLQVLRLEEFEVPCSCFQYLFSAPSLKSLHLNDITFEDYGMKLPCETLEKENCQLETLEITFLNIWVRSFLHENQKNFFNVTCFPRVIELLCSVLAQQNCKLQVLRLEWFKVPCSCFQYLFSAPSLKRLHLRNIFLDDNGMKLPCETLEKENCQLETLEISCFNHFRVYDMDCSLPENQNNLLLMGTCLQHVMELLCSVLAQQNCKLQVLRLEEFKVPCSCFQYLFSAPSLKSMHLSDIILYDDGMKLPCETLEKENCQLETLEISCLKKWLDSFLPENEKNFFDVTCFQRVMELLCSVLAQQNCKLQTLRLEEFKVPCSCFQYLFSAPSLKSMHLSDIILYDDGMKLPCETLEKENCQLETLEISCLKKWLDSFLPENEKNFFDVTCFQRVMELLCSVLAQQNCKLQTLRLEEFKVPCSCFQYLFSAPSLKSMHLSDIILYDDGMKLPCETLEKENCQLETLEISCLKKWLDSFLPENEKNFFDVTCFQRVMELLCSVLAQQNCKLQTLRLEEFKVPCSCFQYLFSAPSLKSMHLSDIILYDDGMKLPCETLEKENCQLETLEISCLKKWLDSFLPENEKNFFDVTCFQRVMELLCSVLAQQNCKLQTLRLEEFKVPCSCFQYLFSAPSLKSMHLSDIILYDDGMKLPCETLEKENCQLETLEISCQNQWTGNEVGFFLSEKEKKLFPKITCIQHVMELLCSVLAQQSCKLQMLRLVDCHLTHRCSQNLFSALICNKSLKDLGVSGNSLEESGIKLLCEALGNSNCKLGTLRLSRCALTTACLQDLLPVICSSENLKTLDLTLNLFDDEGIKLLCETLEKQDCKLETLFFFQPDGLSEESRRALRNLESRKSFPLIVEDYLDVEDYLYS
ncbi:uncharacterized protein [Notamacropus eugenii]|uniref:uncharacterized protein isoform X1 n=1 Tax=Notamacropus eugenii TaxID=9315 RepID=UPI003B66F92F